MANTPKLQENLGLLIGLDTNLILLKRSIQVSEVLALFTTPITLLPALTGFTYIPRWAFFQKPAGTAYNIAGVTSIDIKVGSTVMAGGNGIATGLLDQTGAAAIVMYGPGNAANLFSGNNLTSLSNLSLTISAGGANPTTGNSPLNLVLLYNKFPLAFWI